MNTFAWVELRTPDQGAAKGFYSKLFDWSYDDRPLDNGRIYSNALVEGGRAAGIYEDEQVPQHWNCYISVEDVDDSVREAESLGGKLLMEPLDVPDLGRVTLLQDPSGAVVGLWQEKSNQWTTLFNQHGTLNWNELVTLDTAAARDFYTELLGWTIEEMPMGGGKYGVWKDGDQSTAGMIQITDEWPVDASPQWLAYFDIDDVDARVDRVRAAGAKVMTEPRDTPLGRFALLRDPQGATLAVISASETVQHFPF